MGKSRIVPIFIVNISMFITNTKSSLSILKYLIIHIFLLFSITGILKASRSSQFFPPESILTKQTNKANSTHSILLQYLNAGDSLFVIENMTAAQHAYQQGLNLSNRLKLIWEAALFSNRLGFILFLQQHYNSSEQYYSNALQLCNSDSIIRDSLIFFEAELFTFFYLLENFKTNVKYSKKVERFFTHTTKSNLQEIKKNYLICFYYRITENNNLFNSYLNTNEEQLSLHGPYDIWEIIISEQRAEYYYNINDFNLSLRFYLALFDKIRDTKICSYYKRRLVRQIIYIFQRLHQYEKALSFVEVLNKLPADEKDVSYYYDFILIGNTYWSLGLLDKALDPFLKSLKILEYNNVTDSRLAYLYYFLGKYYSTALKDKSKSLKYLTDAEKILNQYPLPHLESFITKGIGINYYEIKQYDMAILYFNYILDDLDRLLHDEDYFFSRYLDLISSDLILTLEFRGLSYFYLSKQKNFDLTLLKSSFEDYKSVAVLRERLYNVHPYEKSRIEKLDEIRSSYNDCFDVGYTILEQNYTGTMIDTLFQISEKGKAYMLKYFISDEIAKTVANIPEELHLKARDLQKEIDTLQYELVQRNVVIDNSSNQLLIKNLANKLKEQKAFINQLEKNYPDYKKHKRNTLSVSIADIQKTLLNDQVILEYMIACGYLHCFYIDRDTVLLKSTQLSTDISEQIDLFRNNFTGFTYGDYSKAGILQFIDQAHNMYNLCIKPVKHLINNKRLFIVPDESLGTIPFECFISLPSDSIHELNYSKLPYLLRSNSVCYLYSAVQLLDTDRKSSSKASYAGFAPIYTKSENTHNNFPPLPWAQEEVLSIKQYYSGRVFTKNHINKRNFFKACKEHDIVHLAMHAVMDSIEAMNSSLIFQPGEESENLHAYEVYSEPIQSKLVVLSACNTGNGIIVPGEGVFSITRAFLLAGVRNVVYTLWSIADQSSTELIKRFYAKLSKGTPCDVALQQAKLNYLKEVDPVKTHPYYWAGYIQMGRPLQLPAKKNNKMIIGIILLLSITIIGIVHYRRRFKS